MRVRWAFNLAEKIRGDHGWELLKAALGTDEIDDLAIMAGYLVSPGGSITEEHVAVVVKTYGDLVPGLEAAVEELHAEHDARLPKNRETEVAQ
jgi:hypothetical protein